ncbi:cytochrome c-L precursor [bacterium BMS3Bbin02]|nr:cytochrome c-L precursor [bacterium BMS3Bbin02]
MKKLRVPLIVGGVVAAVVLLVLAGGGEPADPAFPRDPMTGLSVFNIPVQDPDLVAEGELLYQASCSVCHGANFEGTAIGPSHLSVIYNPEHHTDAGFFRAMSGGVQAHHWGFGDMPPVVGLSEDDMVAIVAYIRENQRTQGFEAYPPRS